MPLSLPLEVNAADLRAERLVWAVPADLTAALRATATREGASLRATLLAAWVAALWHAAGRPERIAVEEHRVAAVRRLGAFDRQFRTAARSSRTFRQIAFGGPGARARQRPGDGRPRGRGFPPSMERRRAGAASRLLFPGACAVRGDAALRIDSIGPTPGEPNKVALVIEAGGDALSCRCAIRRSVWPEALRIVMTACRQCPRAGGNMAPRVSDVAMLDDATAQALIGK